MNWIHKIAYHQNVRNEIPNQELAKELADTDNVAGVSEIASYLFDKNTSIASDCLKVLYEIGYIKPTLIQDCEAIFLTLLEGKNNRMIWGSMIALATISHLKADQIFGKIDLILLKMKTGTLITEVWGIKVLARVSATNMLYKAKLLPILYDYLEKCRPIDFAARAETILPVVETPNEREVFDKVVALKTPELSEAQSKKLRTILKRTQRVAK